ncbi:MAG: glycosyltransferase [candidate division KSB1 bacterium]|nr:glycosyltransferase [candidate division KSB1 bacterium]MDQ7063074.1 glycosyltransferase [candidate division KSB1 bacterium]
MQLILFILLAVLTALYLTALLLLLRGLSRLPESPPPDEPFDLPTVSIIVAARNEALNLPDLLDCLLRQLYPRDRLQICIVNDRSEDGTAAILDEAARRHPQLLVIHIRDERPDFAPKKRALDAGIRATDGELLLFTDADCRPGPQWVRSMVRYFARNANFVVGYSPYFFPKRLPGLLAGMLSLDNLSLAAVAAAGAGFGRPLTCTGTNLAYGRDVYERVGGFAAIGRWISGDDDLFLNLVADSGHGRFAYALQPDSFVPAAGPVSWRQFWHQRIRYASKSHRYRTSMTVGLVAVYLFNLLMVSGTLSLWWTPSQVGFAAVAAWLLKASFEWRFLTRAAQLFHEQRLLKFFLPTQFVHPLYILLFGFLGLFSRFEWKDGRFEKKTV